MSPFRIYIPIEQEKSENKIKIEVLLVVMELMAQQPQQPVQSLNTNSYLGAKDLKWNGFIVMYVHVSAIRAKFMPIYSTVIEILMFYVKHP